MFPFFLYLITGLTTGFQVFRLIMWAVWGRPPHPIEFVSLAGSLGLITAAVVSLFRPRIAAAVAFVASLAMWAFYGPALVQSYQQIVSDQHLEVVFVKWKPGPEPLSVEGSWENWLTADERAQLHAAGLTGRLIVVGGGTFGRGRQSKAVIVMHQQLDSPVDLLQPDGSMVIYVQDGQNWRMLPSDAPTLERTIHLEVSTHTTTHSLYGVELVNGARSGGTAFEWSEVAEDTDR